MPSEEYEILPHQLLQDLKGEVEALKKKLMAPDAKANELILEIESLKDSIHELTTVFQKALEDIKEEDLAKTLRVINERLDNVVVQNETIAKGMVAIADRVEDFVSRPTQSLSAPMPVVNPAMPPAHTMGIPPLPGQRMAPMPMDAFGSPEMPMQVTSDLPPPPPSPSGKRRGLFR